MAPRKRTRADVEADEQPAAEPSSPSLLQQIRNMWEFASLNQYLLLFGKPVKFTEDLDIEDLEAECLKPHSDVLSQIGLTLLKFVSSHRGLNLDLFDEYTRRQYVAKAPQRNPFGTDETPNKFTSFDVLTKIRILHQLSTWTFYNPDRMRSLMGERESEQTDWRIEPFGWDSDDRTYFLLDDDRLYRRTDPPLPDTAPKRKQKSKPARSKGTRASKRRKVSSAAEESDAEVVEEDTVESHGCNGAQDFGGMKWECLAVSVQEYMDFLQTISRSRDPNEKALHNRIKSDVVPIIERRAEAQQRKEARRQKELEVLQKMTTAKRSSRLADKMEKQREIEQVAEAENKRRADLAMARKEEEKRRTRDEARQYRMMTREQRLKEREVKRILHEEELAKLEENSKLLDSSNARMSERQLKAERERRQKELEALAQDDEWVFDCSVCGMHGANLDDGSHSIACENCNVWQHSVCHGIKVRDAERNDFHFLCADCKRRQEEASRPKLPPLKLRMGSSSPKSAEPTQSDQRPNPTSPSPLHEGPARILDSVQVFTRPPVNNQVVGAHEKHTDTLQTPFERSDGTRFEMTNGFDIPKNGITALTAGAKASDLEQRKPDEHHASHPHIGLSPLSQQSLPPPNALLNNAGVTPEKSNGSHLANGSNSTHMDRPKPSGSLNPVGGTSDRKRPASSHSELLQPGSPVKRTRYDATSPNGHSSMYERDALDSSPRAYFPPTPPQPAAQSPVKQNSSPHPTFSSPSQISNSVRGYSPVKHLSPKAMGNPQRAGAPVLPPIMALSPNPSAQIMDPPAKKLTPGRPQSNGVP